MSNTINLHLCEVFNNEIYKRLEKLLYDRAVAKSEGVVIVLGNLFHDSIRSGKIRAPENIIFEKLLALAKATDAGPEGFRAFESMHEVPFEEFLNALVAVFDAAKGEVAEEKKKGAPTDQDERILTQFRENIDILINFSKKALHGVNREHRRRKIIKYSEKEAAFDHILKKFRETVSSYQKEYREIERVAEEEKLSKACTEFDGQASYKELLERLTGLSFDRDTFQSPENAARFFKTHKKKILAGLYRVYSKLDSLEGSQTWKGFAKSLFGVPETQFHESHSGSLSRGLYAKLSNRLKIALDDLKKHITKDIGRSLADLQGMSPDLCEAEFLNLLYTFRTKDENDEQYSKRMEKARGALLRMKMFEFLRKVALFAQDRDKKTEALDRTLVYLASRLGVHPESKTFLPDIFESSKKEELQKVWDEIRKELKGYRWIEQCDYFLKNEKEGAISKPIPDLVMEIENDFKQL